MQPQSSNHHNPRYNHGHQPQGSKNNKKFSPFVFKFVNQLLFDEQINTKNKYFDQNVDNLNKELYETSLNECVDVLDAIMNTEVKIRQTVAIAHEVIARCLDFGIRPVLVNSYVNLMNKYKSFHQGLVNTAKIQQLTTRVHPKNLPYLIEAFDLKLDVKKVQQSIDKFCKNNNYDSAIKMAQKQRNKNQLLQIIAQNVLNSENYETVQYVSEEIVRLGGDKVGFKKLHEKGLRMQMDHIYSNDGFYYAEEVYRYNPIMMKIITERMINDPKINKNQFLSFCARNPEVIESIGDRRLVDEIQMLQKILPNPIQTNIFGPSDNKKYFHLSQLGIKEEDVIFINSSTPNLQLYLRYIAESDVLGLDTESFVARSKFSTDLQLIATIQISDGKKAFIIDAKDCANPLIPSILSEFFLNPAKILVGHTLKDDFDGTLQALGIKSKSKCKCVDVKHLFKPMYPGVRAGLQSISQKVLGKPICKEYTLTDWGRRPLLKNQLHYAALDAVVVIPIYKKLKEKKHDGDQPKFQEKKIKLI